MAQLALIRHSESVYNSENKECGWIDSPLTPYGHEQAQEVAKRLPNIHWDFIFESDLIRSQQTTDEIIKILCYTPTRISSDKIKERNYGIYAGLDKKTVSQEIRRGWNVTVEGGENLKQVYNRAVPYYQNEILPKLKSNKNIIISAHGNSLRALVKYIENISDEEIPYLEIATGEIYLYEINHEGQVVSKQILKP